MYDDTIAAISTAVGDAGIGIVRLSGRDATSILRRVFRPAGMGRGEGETGGRGDTATRGHGDAGKDAGPPLPLGEGRGEGALDTAPAPPHPPFGRPLPKGEAIATPLQDSGLSTQSPEPGAHHSSLITHDSSPSWPIESHRAYYGHAVDPATGTVIDEVLAISMLLPRSYTREDVVEIHCHGGPVPVQKLLQTVLQAGARLALPGEFTLRAYLNGRIDLAQAEAVADVIRSRTDRGLSLALKGLSGQLSSRVREVRQQLLRVLAYLEATIDFGEDDIPEEDVQAPLSHAASSLDRLLATAGQGIIYRQGVRVALVGRPNVGKSSLLNALLRSDRAIVTEIAGTTRDTLEEVANFSGVPVCLVDTAGIASSENLVERLGIERSRRALEEADLCLMVVDWSAPLGPEDTEIALSAVGKATVVVANKADLPPAMPIEQLESLVPGAPVVPTSSLTGLGLEDIQEAVLSAVISGRAIQSDELLVSNPRHQAVLSRAASHLQDALDSLRAGLPADCTASDIRMAVDALGEITGETAAEGLLETIFSHFCIGK